MSGFEGSYAGDATRIGPATRLECGVCWQIYDPASGDPVWQIPPGVAFADLPEHWRCPNCDAERRQFMALDGPAEARPARPERPAGAEALERRVAALEEAYRAAQARMRRLPVHNDALEVAAIGFRRIEDAYLGVVVTPWCMNLTRLPLDAGADAPPEGAVRRRALPSGAYEFVSGRLPGVGPLETCSLFSPMEPFAEMAVARLVAEHAIAEATSPVASASSSAAAASATAVERGVNRRALLTGGAARI